MITRALVVLTAIALLFTVASHARAQGFLDGIRSIDVTMHRVETCIASQYGVGDGYNGKRTASGERFNTYARRPYTVAMRKPHPLGSWVTVTNLRNGKSILAKVTDRGPFVRGRCVDLGRAGADDIEMDGTAKVTVE